MPESASIDAITYFRGFIFMTDRSKSCDPVDTLFAEIKHLQSARVWAEGNDVIELVEDIDRAIKETQKDLRRYLN